MSEFDRKVLEWLNEADLQEKSKQAVLDRTAAGINTYKMLLENNPKLGDAIPLDLSLSDVIARASRRLKDKETPIVVLSPSSVPRLALRPSGSRANSRPATARSTAGSTARDSENHNSVNRPIARPLTASARAALMSKPTPIPKHTKTPSRPAATATTAKA